MEDLWKLYKQTNRSDIREKLVYNYLNLVNIVVGKIIISLPKHINKDDLISYGYFGLLDAIEKFDIERGFKFETYASYRIRGSIFDELRSQDWVKSSVRKLEKKYVSAVAKIEQANGKSATDEEIAKAMDMTVDEYNNFVSELDSTSLLSMDEYTQNNIKANQNYEPEQIALKSDFSDTLTKAIEKLPEKEKIVLSLYYFEELNLKEIGQVLNLSESRISRVHAKAIYRLKSLLINKI